MSSFEEAAEKIKTSPNLASLTDEKKLEIYALFKQGSIGDVNTARPGMLDFKGKAKWDAWEKKKGMTQDEAKELYVELIESVC